MDNRIPNQLGYLLLNEEGAVISSSGALENDERSADIIMSILQLTGNLQQLEQRNQNILSHTQARSEVTDLDSPLKKVSLVYDDHCYVICLSNRRIHVVKKTFSPPANVQGDQINQGGVHAVHV